MAQIGSKENSILNREWGKHIRKSRGHVRKRNTSKRRRLAGKKDISGQLQEKAMP